MNKFKSKNIRPTHIPVIIGNYAPFRLILRDHDIWNPSLKEINNGEYDYVKLCRMSSFVDVGIYPFSMGISFDGSLVLPATKEFTNKESALEKFNETLGFLLLGGVYSEAVQPSDISYGSLFVDGYLRQTGRGLGHQAIFHQAIQTKCAGSLDVIQLADPKTIRVNEIENAYKVGKEYFVKIKGFSPNILLYGTSHYVRHQWNESLIFLWTSIEQILDIIWRKEIIGDSKNKGLDIDGRIKLLEDYRTWTTSAKIELLYQRGFILAEHYKHLNVARKSRNSFVHGGSKISKLQVKSALDGLFILLSMFISSYKDSSLFEQTIETIENNLRGDILPSKKVFDIDEIKYWRYLPPLPGDKNWGNEKYEVIDELVLKPII